MSKFIEFAFSINEAGSAVVTRDNEIIGEGYNSVIRNNSTIHHAEINAIRMACKNIGNYRLNDCDIFITLEPVICVPRLSLIHN